jgi:hypothetical protein
MDNLGQGKETDRRAFERITENREAKIAPVNEGQNVTRDTIQVVRCKDRAACGFSFYSHARPDYQHVAEILGPHFKPVAYHAEVIHVTPAELEGQAVWVVGCRYTGRIEEVAAPDSDMQPPH